MTQSMKRIHKVTIYHKPDPHHEGVGHIGIYAEAEVLLDIGHATLNQPLTSGGVWNVSPCAEDIPEIEKQELEWLRQVLHDLAGFSQRAISAAFKKVVRP